MTIKFSETRFNLPCSNITVPEWVEFFGARIILSEKINDKFKTACVAEFMALMFFVTMCGGAVMSNFSLPSNTYGQNNFVVACSFGFAIMCLAQIVGPLSGGHINSAVSFALFVSGRCSFFRLVFYTVFQMMGAFVGAFWLWAIFGPHFAFAFAANQWDTNQYSAGQIFLAETICTMTLVLCVFATIDIPKDGGGALGVYPIAMSVFVAHLILIPVDGCSINPPRSFGSWAVSYIGGVAGNYRKQQYMFWIAPNVGALLAALLYEYSGLVRPKKRVLKQNLEDAIFMAQVKRKGVVVENDAEDPVTPEEAEQIEQQNLPVEAGMPSKV